MTVFTFLEDPSQEQTTIEFTGEDPYLQYVSDVWNGIKKVTMDTELINNAKL